MSRCKSELQSAAECSILSTILATVQGATSNLMIHYVLPELSMYVFTYWIVTKNASGTIFTWTS